MCTHKYMQIHIQVCAQDMSYVCAPRCVCANTYVCKKKNLCAMCIVYVYTQVCGNVF